ncbi:hypothetical protein ISN44_As08g030360 [Arabidopsis suecica]|uniref:DUF4283 domain-containing protein n=1 Tax=Arabidopsis suecica TaxID=45249 RepID=A0A8T2B8S7_ARASU|nr:hypothetical protein ISN44_As08g030360 [Arabidopsis suecica]
MMDVGEKGRPPGEPPDGHVSWVKKVMGSDGEPVIMIGHEVLEAMNGLWKRCMIVKVERDVEASRRDDCDGFASPIIYDQEFDLLRDEIATTPVWVRLSNLPVNFYHRSILLGIAKGLGHPIKVDLTTLKFERARFARVCVEVNLKKPLKGTVMVNGESLSSWPNRSRMQIRCGEGEYTEHGWEIGKKKKRGILNSITIIMDDFDESVDRHQLGVDRHHTGNRSTTFADYNRPALFYSNRSAIRPPPPSRADFAFKPWYYDLVSNNRFDSFEGELPFDHIEKFEDMVSSIKEVRLQISSFSQGPTKSFKAAWLKFGSYQRNCPHHGFTEIRIRGIFFKGIDYRYQIILDGASNGNFTSMTPSEAVNLNENSASSYGIRGIDNERRQLAAKVDSKQLEQAEIQSVRTSCQSIQHPAHNTTPTPPSTSRLEAMLEAIYKHQLERDATISDLCRLTPIQISKKLCCDEAKLSCLDTDLQDHSTRRLKSSKFDTRESTPDCSVDRHSSSVDRHWNKTAPICLESPLVTGKVYTPQVPCPLPRQSKQEILEERCMGIIDEILLQLPPVDIEKLSPLFQSALILDDKKLIVSISELVSDINPSRIPKKLPDPGSFVLDCSISTDRFPRSLCDLGSSINLLPHSVGVRLGMTNFKATRITLLLADRSKRIPDGILEDVPVKIGQCLIPTDFVVLEYEEEPPDLLILGRSFLAFAGARIDVKLGQIALHVCDVVMNYDMDKLRKLPTIDGQAFSVETSIDTVVDPGKITADIPGPVVTTTNAPLPLHPPPKRLRYSSLPSKPPDFINKTLQFPKTVLRFSKPRVSRRALVLSFDDCAGKRSRLPIPLSCPADVPHFLGQPHTPTAYTPPWMMRGSTRKYLLPPSDPPDS